MRMNNAEFRRLHLIEAIKLSGTAEELGKTTGINPQYLSSIKRGARDMGKKSAQAIEKAVGWPSGTMDLPLGEKATNIELAYLIKTAPENVLIRGVIGAFPELSADGIKKLTVALMSHLTEK